MGQPGRWAALFARTRADARDYMVEGPGGILLNTPPHERPNYEPSKRRLTWPNGSWGTIYTDEDPDQARGFSGDTAWWDEFGKYKRPEACWDNLQFGMREISADRPRQLITTTPRPLPILSKIERRSDTVVVVGSSYENRANLDAQWMSHTLGVYEGTRIGRQEIHAEILDDNPEALWKRSQIEDTRLDKLPGPMTRIVVGVDPQARNQADSAETGIVVAGFSRGRWYVLDDMSIKASPEGWARQAVRAYHKYAADRIIGEINNGGDMVEHTVRTVDPNVSYKAVSASRGKQIRAEPISALYEQGRVHHVGVFPELEDQMCEWVPGRTSPDRMDALVWSLTELMTSSNRIVIYHEPRRISTF